jgi:hypothetical protein
MRLKGHSSPLLLESINSSSCLSRSCGSLRKGLVDRWPDRTHRFGWERQLEIPMPLCSARRKSDYQSPTHLRNPEISEPYGQVSLAVPLTVADVFWIPLLIVNCKLWGALAVTVTMPGAEQVASPVEPMVAATLPVLVGEVFQERPSICDSSRLLPFAKFPIAV